MIRNSTKRLKFDWLSEESKSPLDFIDPIDDIEWTGYSVPKNIGTAGFERIQLQMGISLYHAKHDFISRPSSKTCTLADIEVSFHHPCFQALTISAGSINHREAGSGENLFLRPGYDLYRYTDYIRTTPIIDTSISCRVVAITISRPTMDILMGSEMAEIILKYLDLTTQPVSAIHATPSVLSMLLQNIIPSGLSGEVRKLYCLSRVLEYLSTLLGIALVSLDANPDSCHSFDTTEIRHIHNMLVNHEGKIPNIEGLSERFGYSPQALNKAFKEVYGESLFTVVKNARMDEAHQAILQTNVELKTLAKNLGYSHVNHFSNAFRNRFGYSPGSLRNK